MATTVKKKGGTTESVVIQNIQIRPVVRTSQDIAKWRAALQSAEAMVPVRIPLYDLYADLLLDGVLTSLIDKRVLGVTKTKLAFVDSSGKEVEDMQPLIHSHQFRQLRKQLQLQKLWGKKLVELQRDGEHFKIYAVPVKHVKPHLGKITWEQYGEEGIEYRQPPYSNYILDLGSDKDLGLLLQAAQYVIYKRGGFGDWAHFAEIFGMPFREARYDGFNQQVRAQLELALEQAGSAAYAILPKEAEITFHEAKSTQGSSQLYNDLRKACNEELSILILGQTETTTSSDSSGYAQSQTHLTVEGSLNQSDREDELSIMNEQVLPILANLGYNVKGGEFVHIPDKEKLSLKDKADVIVKLKNEGKLPIGDDYLYEEFGIPKPPDYAVQKKKAEDAAIAATKPPAPPAAPVKKKPSKLAAVLNKLYSCDCGVDHLGEVKLAAGDDALMDLVTKLARRIFKNKAMPDTIDKKVTMAFAKEFSKAVSEGFGSSFDGVDYDTPDGEMLGALRRDIYHFSAAKNWQQLKDLSNALVDENSKLRSFAEFKQAAYEINSSHVNQWLKTEYNTAVTSAQMAATWVRIQADKATLPMLEFDAVMDQRTSDLCSSLNGVVRAVDDAFWATYYPPNHFSCRSDVRQVTGRAATPVEQITYPDLPNMFKTNLAQNGLVFPPKHPYYLNCPADIKEAGASLIQNS